MKSITTQHKILMRVLISKYNIQFNLQKYLNKSSVFKVSVMNKSTMMERIKNCIPPLDNKSHKGQAGRIGIVGGSLEYTGAPYFAGISALKVGADLVHVFCASSAATVIKSYSPELIVHPLLDHANALSEISPWLERLHAIVIGPGLGREPKTFDVVSNIITEIKQRKIPLVIDADGLFLITENPLLLKDFISPVILTPNKIEFQRLSDKMSGLCELFKISNNVVVLKKGAEDELLCNSPAYQWNSVVGGSGRRCGGQGDLLSGSIATFLHWSVANSEGVSLPEKSCEASSLACLAASTLIRKCNEKAFKVKGRSMLAGDMIDYIHDAFEELYGQ